MFDATQTAKRMHRRIVQVTRDRAFDGDCPICLDTLKKRAVVVAPCGHPIHLQCEAALRRSECAAKLRCPTCRAWTASSLVPYEERVFEDLLSLLRQWYAEVEL